MTQEKRPRHFFEKALEAMRKSMKEEGCPKEYFDTVNEYFYIHFDDIRHGRKRRKRMKGTNE